MGGIVSVTYVKQIYLSH